MTYRSLLSRFAGPALSSLALLGSLNAHAQTAAPETSNAPVSEETAHIENFVVSASRTPQDPKWVSSSVTSLALPELSLEQWPTLASALQTVPGVIIANSGAHGGQSSIFLRGASSHQLLFVVDGVRMNDRSTAYQNFLGGATLGGIDRLEVLRGPQSTLYGSTAIGGIVLIDTARGHGKFHGLADATAGSWNSFGGGLSIAGSSGPVSASAHVDHAETDNELPDNGFKQTSESARVEGNLTPTLLIGATVRADQSRYQEVGSRLFASKAEVDNDNTLTTAYLKLKSGDDLDSRLTLAYHERHYTYTASWGGSDLRNRRKVIDWQNTWQARRDLEVIAGIDYETSTFTINGAPGDDRVAAGYVSSTFRPTSTVVVTAGARHDDYHSAGGTTTGRAGISWIPVSNTKLRASWGTGFVAPGVDDRYGVSEWGQLPNPDLKPEESNGWDVGIEQSLPSLSTDVSLTYFDTSFKDLFSWKSLPNYQGQIVNIARAESQGLELAGSSRWSRWVKTRVSYTYLEARDSNTRARLVRRPRHTLDGELVALPFATQSDDGSLSVGIGAHAVVGNFDTDETYVARTLASHTTVRVFASYNAAKSLTIRARVENALDRDHEEVFGYPAPGRAFYTSVEYAF